MLNGCLASSEWVNAGKTLILFGAFFCHVVFFQTRQLSCFSWSFTTCLNHLGLSFSGGVVDVAVSEKIGDSWAALCLCLPQVNTKRGGGRVRWRIFAQVTMLSEFSTIFLVGLVLKYLYPFCNQIFRIIVYRQVIVGGLQIILPCHVPSTIFFVGLELKYLYPLCNQVYKIGWKLFSLVMCPPQFFLLA